MTTDIDARDIEARLRADLPRLADLLAARRDSAMPSPDRRRPWVGAALAAVLVVVLVVGVLVVAERGGEPDRVSAVGSAGAHGGWRALAGSDLGSRMNVAAVWTGSEVVVWGGNVGRLFAQDGAAYDPVTESWHAITPNQWAGPGSLHAWTGDRLVVAGKRSAAAYDPVDDTWTELGSLPDEVRSGFAGLTWSGADLYGAVWGDGALRIARYDPSADRWILGAAQPAPDDRPATAYDAGWVYENATTWVGDEVVVWDGTTHGWAYRPATDSWQALPDLPGDVGTVTSDLVALDGRPVVVAVGSGADGPTLRAARLEGDRWVPVVETTAPDFRSPVATVTGHRVYVVDRAGTGTPLRIAVARKRATRLAGSPVVTGPGTDATWAGDGLFVWGGIPDVATERGTVPADAAWYGPR